MRNIVVIFAYFVFLFNALALDKEPEKQAMIIVLGAGNEIKHEYGMYAQSLNDKGYTVNIHSFDPRYSDGDWTGLNYDISVLENGEWVKYGLNNQKFKHITHVVYDRFDNDYVTSEYEDPKNTVNLIRYGAKVLQYNKTGMYIKDMAKNIVEAGNHLIFIDSVNCGELQTITKELFNLYKDKGIFLHAVHNWVQPITLELIDLKCEISPKKAFGCEKTIDQYTETGFNAIKNINKLTQDKTFKKLTNSEKQKLRNSFNDIADNMKAMNFTPSCISQSLKNSKFSKIDNEVVEEYINKIVLSNYKKLANKD